MIYDGHAYSFPPTSQIAARDNPDQFWQYLQMSMATARQQPVWRKRDRMPGDSSGLIDPSRPWDFAALKDANFRTADHGLVEWEVGGDVYVKQALPPWTKDFSFPPQALIAEMDYAGVDMALLHRTPYMGINDDYIAACVRAYPDRIQGLAYVEEWRIRLETDRCIAKLDRAINELGLHGYQFMPQHMEVFGQDRDWLGQEFKPFWDVVSSLNVPVFFTMAAGVYEDYLGELLKLRLWMERYPDVTVVATHGFNWRLFADDETLHVPDEVFDVVPIASPNYHVQILFAVFLQSRWTYPMPQIRPTLEKMVERIGGEKIIWGTDIPMVLLHWTYAQTLNHIRDYCDFITDNDMDLMLGGNMERIMGD